MAIKIAGTSVIDDSKNIVNVVAGTFTGTVTAPTFSGALSGNATTATTATNVSGGSISGTNLTYTGTLTGSTGILNIGSGQIYKDASGNVGIGTSSPTDKLHIETSNINEDGIVVKNTSSYTGGTGTHIYMHSHDGTSTSNSGGLLATNSSWTYHGYGANSISLTATKAGELNLMAPNASGVIKFFTGGDNTSNERMRIDSSGNVGIGTSSPQRRLHLRSTSESTGLFLERASNYGFSIYNQIVGSTETLHIGNINNNTFVSDIKKASDFLVRGFE